jgi:aspartyl-tRNA(Asn)/glutamyl-tRNA(Gln) amidotransferase subunit A
VTGHPNGRPHTLPISRLAPLIASRQVSPVAITEACLEDIAARNGELNAFIEVLADAARAEALTAEREIAAGGWRGPLHGIPVSVKDLIDVRGTATTAASRVTGTGAAREDALIVRRLRRSGAVVIGKCNLHEFAIGTTNDESAFGPARNPWNPERSPGGSSGGSAAAVASGMSCASIGTDTGGSIRIPSAACGLVGLKATYGELPCDGIVPLSRSLDHVGPLARTVSDAWLLYDVMLGEASESVVSRAAPPVAGVRLGIPRGYFLDLLDEDVRARFDEAVERLQQAGATTVDVSVPHAQLIAPVYLHIMLPEACAYHAATLESRPEAYTEGVRMRLEMGRYLLAEDHVRARMGAAVLKREVDEALESCDALALPTLPIPAPQVGEQTISIGGSEQPVRALMLRLTQLFDVTGHPAISLPCGFARGLPCGLQLAGRQQRTNELLALAIALEELVKGEES